MAAASSIVIHLCDSDSNQSFDSDHSYNCFRDQDSLEFITPIDKSDLISDFDRKEIDCNCDTLSVGYLKDNTISNFDIGNDNDISTNDDITCTEDVNTFDVNADYIIIIIHCTNLTKKYQTKTKFGLRCSSDAIAVLYIWLAIVIKSQQRVCLSYDSIYDEFSTNDIELDIDLLSRLCDKISYDVAKSFLLLIRNSVATNNTLSLWCCKLNCQKEIMDLDCVWCNSYREIFSLSNDCGNIFDAEIMCNRPIFMNTYIVMPNEIHQYYKDVTTKQVTFKLSIKA